MNNYFQNIYFKEQLFYRQKTTRRHWRTHDLKMEFYIEKKILQNILNTKKVYDVLSKKSPDESMWTKNLKNIFYRQKISSRPSKNLLRTERPWKGIKCSQILENKSKLLSHINNHKILKKFSIYRRWIEKLKISFTALKPKVGHFSSFPEDLL